MSKPYYSKSKDSAASSRSKMFNTSQNEDITLPSIKTTHRWSYGPTGKTGMKFKIWSWNVNGIRSSKNL